jgi:CRISPR-associated protein (TIGR03986 family)
MTKRYTVVPDNTDCRLLEGQIKEVDDNSSQEQINITSPYSVPSKEVKPENLKTVEFEQKQFNQNKAEFWQIEPEPRLAWVYQNRYLKQDKRYPPYHFVPVAKKKNADEVDAILDKPMFHNGNSEETVYSGELCCTLTALTPLLVANDQYLAKEVKEVKIREHDQDIDLPDSWNIKSLKDKEKKEIGVNADKSVLEPLRLPDGRVLIPGASLKGMLRQSISALLTAPMERVAERTYSYRLNTKILENEAKGKRYKCYPAIVKQVDSDGIPLTIRLLTQAKQNDVKYRKENTNPTDKAFRYKYGLDEQGILLWTHEKDDPKHKYNLTRLKQKVWVAEHLLNDENTELLSIPAQIKAQYQTTIEHLSDRQIGHLTGDHQLLRKIEGTIEELSQAIKDAGKMQKDQLIYVEVIEKHGEYRITSLGHHFRYHWRYADTVRTRWHWNQPENKSEPQTRSVLQPLTQEKGECPDELSAGRLLFGYVNDKKGTAEKGTAEIGKDNFSRLAGRIALNMAVEAVDKDILYQTNTHKIKRKKKPNSRFLNEDKGYTVALKELAQPRPSAVEFYLQQDGERPDRGSLITYGDVAEEDKGGELRGRKFYLHQPAAADLANKDLYETNDDEVKASNQASLARFVSVPGTTFRFTLNFRDLRLWELGALLTTLEPEYLLDNIEKLPDVENLYQYVNSLKKHEKPEKSPLLAHKLGHGRPLGLGSVQISIDEKRIADSLENLPSNSTEREHKIAEQAQAAFMNKLKETIEQNPQQQVNVLKNWLGVHQFRGQVQSAYPEHAPGKEEPQIYEFHTALRQRHARNRQFEKPSTGEVRKETLVLPEIV